jgi:epoxyqueuosine reductase QueG
MKMNKTDICKAAAQFVENEKDNYITKEFALSAEIIGMKIFEEPIFAFGSAADPYFNEFKKPTAIGDHFRLPQQWLPEAKTVISFFLPYSQELKRENTKDSIWPADAWLHGRIEGQAFLNKLTIYLKSILLGAGYNSIVPSLDGNFWAKARFNPSTPHPQAAFTSNWSERHVAFICGLGTFGLSKGLITAKGVAGRLASVITELELPPDTRNYKSIYEYCSLCGACVKKCPVGAISIEKGKDHMPCSAFSDKTAEKYAPRYGCGKCQTGVPCESKIPLRTTY